MEQKNNPYLCMGLVRLIGGICFVAVALPLFINLSKTKGMDTHYIYTIIEIGWPAYKLAILAGLAGLVGMIIGQGIGASIKVHNDKIAGIITLYWHYIVNGIGFWLIGTTSIATVSLGGNAQKDAIMTFFLGPGKDFGISAIFYGALAGFLVATWGIIQLVKGNQKLMIFPPLIVTALLGYIHFSAYGIPIKYLVIHCILFPIMLYVMSAYLFEKDMQRRGIGY